MSPVLGSLRDQVHAEVDTHAAQIVRLSAINSGSGNDNGITSVMRELGQLSTSPDATVNLLATEDRFHIDAEGSEQPFRSGPVFHLALRPDQQRRLMIAGHADTVFGPNHTFQSVVRDGSVLRGPGVADMKGGLVAAVTALNLVSEHGLALGMGIDLVVNGDEEVGSLGSASTLQNLGRQACAALVVEPRMEDGRLARARAGSANVTVRYSGRTSHAGRALADGRNAVLAAADLALRLEGIGHPNVGVNIASLHGGDALNSVPAASTVRFNARSESSNDLQSVVDAARTLADQVGQDREVGSRWDGGIHRPAKPWTDASAALAEIVSAVGASLGDELEFVDTRGVCDGNNLSSLGLAVVDTLGVRGHGIHTPDERTDMASFGTTVATLVGVIDAVAHSLDLRRVDQVQK